MYDLIPPCGALHDVAPGDPWQPEPAARYNAVNELLRQENAFIPPQEEPKRPGRGDILYVSNISDKVLPVNSAVEIETWNAPEQVYGPSYRNIYAYGKPVENVRGFWGVALENIHPGMMGPVQVSGIAAVDVPEKDFEVTLDAYTMFERKVRQHYIFPGRDGRFHTGTWGGAEVIWANPRMPQVLVRLGARSNDYEGMFAVFENGDGTLTVKGGETDLVYGDNGADSAIIKDTLLPVEYVYAGDNGRVICLVARWDGKMWNCQVLSLKGRAQTLYIPGEQIYWELARYAGVRSDGTLLALQQLWTGGIINFQERYYIR
ncbi:MAG: hypothetical protein J6S54_08285 [Lentisphaeria bacterium]|nr:hypothetical protein [Lentisphaeria bacterium]